MAPPDAAVADVDVDVDTGPCGDAVPIRHRHHHDPARPDTDTDARHPPGTRTRTGAPRTSGTPPIPAAGPGVGQDFGGLPVVGRMFLVKGGGSYFCTASVVASPAATW